MNGDRNVDEIRARVEARVQELAEQAVRDVDRVMADVGQELDELKAQFHAETGLDLTLPWAPAPSVPAAMDATMGHVSSLAVSARHLLAAVELLRPHVEPCSTVTVGALAKTRLSQRKSARVLEHLRQSGFFADGGEVADRG